MTSQQLLSALQAPTASSHAVYAAEYASVQPPLQPPQS